MFTLFFHPTVHFFKIKLTWGVFQNSFGKLHAFALAWLKSMASLLPLAEQASSQRR